MGTEALRAVLLPAHLPPRGSAGCSTASRSSSGGRDAPPRLFAPPAKPEALPARFRATALALAALVGAAFALGAVAGAVR